MLQVQAGALAIIKKGTLQQLRKGDERIRLPFFICFMAFSAKKSHIPSINYISTEI